MTETKRTVSISKKDERGVASVIALLVAALLYLMGVMFLSVSSTESTMASSRTNGLTAFYLSDAGIEHARRSLQGKDLSQVLDGTTSVFAGGNTVNLAGGTYTVQVTNNILANGFPLSTIPADPSASATVDSDGIIVVTSTGTFLASQRIVEATFQIAQLPTPDGALEVITSDELEVELDDGAVIDGRDWDPPPDPSSCTSIATCGTLTGNPDIAGASTNSDDFDVEVSNGSDIIGTPETKVNTSLSATPWNNLIDQLIPQADRNLSVPEKLTGTHTWGTASAPEITLISGKDIEVESGAVVNGAGLLIIDVTGELELDHGILNWQGLIIVRGEGELEVEFEDDDDATARIFGALILIASGGDEDEEVELEIENDSSFIKFSRSAIALVQGSVLPKTVLSWREVSM